jgi:membrane-bound serine protease (ClpP class)
MPKIPTGRAARRGVLLFVGVLLVALGLAGCAGSIDERNAVHVATLDGTIGPVTADYVKRAIGDAEDSDAVAIVLRLDTPGGLLDSTRDIVRRINSSQVPVMVYVWPPGGRAASAGTFITMAGHVAAMAPSTNIGAASPVGGSGEDIEGTLGKKVTEDAAAFARTTAEKRGRNVDWADKAVREAVSATESEALELDVIDFVASDLRDLLSRAEGRTVQLPQGEVTLRVQDAPIVENDMSLVERFLLILSDPNIAFILLSLGMLGLTFEIIYPGGIFPGVFGAIALILAFFSLGTLPTNWAGVALIILAFVLFFAELLVAGFGVLGAGAVISLILGGLLLTSTNDPEFQVSRWLIYGLAAVIGVFFLMVVSAILRSRRLPAVTGTQALIGRTGVVRSPLEPEGQVFLEGERWTATAEDGPIREGENVIVTGVHGLRLEVKREAAEGEPADSTAADERPEGEQ